MSVFFPIDETVCEINLKDSRRHQQPPYFLNQCLHFFFYYEKGPHASFSSLEKRYIFMSISSVDFGFQIAKTDIYLEFCLFVVYTCSDFLDRS